MSKQEMGNDTIFALASGSGRAAIAVLRLSGKATASIVKGLAGKLSEPRVATLATLRDPRSGEALDRALLIWFPAPRSFTGEDCAEFHLHGGQAVVAAVIKAIGMFTGTRPAEPGEFTRRALLNGKMDLAEVEGLADLIDSETEWQRRQALRQMEGTLSRQAVAWRKALLEASALIEAEIDFSDEPDVPDLILSKIEDLITPVLTALETELAAGQAGERIREGLTVVISGPPNAGKSTLMNALARRDVAIVSPHAGTTRDMLEVHLDIGGCPITLIDTAGLREAHDSVEQIGVARALKKAESADLVLWLNEAGAPMAPLPDLSGTLWPVFTKADLHVNAEKGDPSEGPNQEINAKDALYISAETGQNLDVLTKRISGFARSLTHEGHAGLITRERHRRAFTSAGEALQRVLSGHEDPIEFLAEDLRAAIHAMEKISGSIDVEDILSEIFSRFCIGK